MPSVTKEKSGSLYWSVCLVSLLPAYVLSVGPVSRLFRSMGWDRKAIGVMYSPLIWLYDNTPLQGPLDWYISLWTGR